MDQILEKIKERLKNVEGIAAIVLGGSRAKGNYTNKSDIDLGIYYQDSFNFDLESLNRIATELDELHRNNLITKVGEWGPWINGGGWLSIDGVATDFLFRDLNKVTSVINDCLTGHITIDYQPGHPHGFINAIYAAEIHYCNIIWSKDDTIKNLKNKLIPYHPVMKTGIINKFLWEANFSNVNAVKGVYKNDPIYTAGCIYRTISCLVQVLYALNETYIMNEKGAIDEIEAFKIKPNNFKRISENLFYSFDRNIENMKFIIEELNDLILEVELLCSKTM